MPLVLELIADKLQRITPNLSLEEYWFNNNNIYLGVWSPCRPGLIRPRPETLILSAPTSNPDLSKRSPRPSTNGLSGPRHLETQSLRSIPTFKVIAIAIFGVGSTNLEGCSGCLSMRQTSTPRVTR